MKKRILNKIQKNNVIEYVIITTITILLCQNFIQMHYSSDTYVLYDLGYMAYPEKYFLLDGRLISSLVCYIAGILKIPIECYIVGMDFIGIVLIATAIYLVYKTIEQIITPDKNTTKIAILAGTFILILNQFSLEYLLFPESAVMCLGLLLNVVAIRLMITNPKYKYIKIFITLLIATICYQGLLNIFPVLALTIYIIKQIVDKREYKVKEKEFFFEMLKLAIIVLLVLGISLMVVKIGKIALNSNQDRMMHLISFEAVKLRAETVGEYLEELWTNSMQMLPKYTGDIVLLITIILLIISKTKKEFIMQYILLTIITFSICAVPMFIFNTGICGRVNVPLMMLWGEALLILLAQMKNCENEITKSIVYGFIFISFIINNIFIMQNTTEHIASNRIEENNGKTIKYAIEKYEQETGNVVSKFSYVYDINPNQYAVGIKKIGSLTERKLACSWSIVQTMNYYCDRKFDVVGMNTELFMEYFGDKDYSEFSEEQLVFVGDTLYMLVY